MFSLKIGMHERNELYSVEESWIIRVINSYRKNNEPFCVLLQICKDDVNISLASSNCAKGGGGFRQPNNKEFEIVELWNKLQLNREAFSPGQLIAFIKQLQTKF